MGKGKKWLIGCLGTLGICGIGTYIAVSPYVDFLGASRDLDKEVARANALGNPLTAAELVPPMPADKDNAAVELGPILRAPKSDQLSNAGSDALDAVARKEYARADSLIGPHQAALSAARKAAGKPKFAMERDWDTGIDLLFPEYAQSKGLTKLLAAQAQIDFRKGNYTLGGDNLRAGYKLGEFIGQEPILIGMLVEIANRAIISRTVETIAVANQSRESALASLESAVGKRPAPNFATALKGEMFFGTSTIRNLDKYGGFTQFIKSMSDMDRFEGETSYTPPDPKTLRREGMPGGALEKAFMTRHLALWNDALEEMKKTSDPQVIAKWLVERSNQLEKKKALSYVLLQVMLPVFGQAGEAVVRCQATEGATRGFLKVLRFRAKTGRYPKDLAEAGFNEVDPFSKSAYKYFQTGDVVRVYSVGRNGIDEEGLGKESSGGKILPDQLDDIAVRTDRPIKLPPVSSRGVPGVLPPGSPPPGSPPPGTPPVAPMPN